VFINILVVIAGLLFSLYLFQRFPWMEGISSSLRKNWISVIIPARNEEKNLPLLLADLMKQRMRPFEVICADDASTDGTSGIAGSFDIRLLSLKEKPAGWIGKSWACQNGAKAANGDFFLFLDADVRLGPDAVSRLVRTYEQHSCVLSVQPYHSPVKAYEQFSFFFNLIQFSANGLGLADQEHTIGLNGPVILIPRKDYEMLGGHESVKSSIIDDIALGMQLKKKRLPYKMFLGDKDFAYRMYNGGIKELLHGWTKNQASAAMKMAPVRFLMIFCWVTALASVPFHLIVTAASMQWSWCVLYLFLYFVWVLELMRISRPLGRFSMWTVLFYPLFLLVFIGVFILSMIKKLFHGNVVWKGRKIELK
jgi:4,4'-diaponeurosporenoate glycosyltransferase